MRRNLVAAIAIAVSAAVALIGQAHAQSAQPVTLLKVAHASPSPQHTAYWVAKAEKFFDDEGIQVENIELGGGGAVLQALTAGHVQIGLFSISTAIQARSFDKKLIVVAGLGNRALQVPIVSAAFLKSHGIDPTKFRDLPLNERLAALKGSRWSVNSAAGLVDAKVRQLASSAGYQVDKDIEIIPFAGGTGANVTLLKRGRFDASFFEPPYDLDLTRDGSAVAILDPRRSTDLPRITLALQSQVIVDENWANQNENVLKRFGRAIVRASEFIHKQPRERVAAGLRKEFPELSTEHLVNLVDSIIDAIPVDARLPKDVIEINIELAQSAGDPKRPKPKLSAEDIYTERFLPAAP